MVDCCAEFRLVGNTALFGSLTFLIASSGKVHSDINPDALEQIRALPPEALVALGGAFEVLILVPERGSLLNPDNLDGGLFHFTFGQELGLITYLLLTSWIRVDVLLVT